MVTYWSLVSIGMEFIVPVWVPLFVKRTVSFLSETVISLQYSRRLGDNRSQRGALSVLSLRGVLTRDREQAFVVIREMAP